VKYQPRDPVDVIAAVLEAVPEEQVIFRKALSSLAESARYAPPENSCYIWRKLQRKCLLFCNWPPKYDWEQKVCDIVENRITITVDLTQLTTPKLTGDTVRHAQDDCGHSSPIPHGDDGNPWTKRRAWESMD